MKKETKELIKLIEMGQEDTYAYVLQEVLKLPDIVVKHKEGEYIYISTDNSALLKPLLTAHMDTINDTLPKSADFDKVNWEIEGGILKVADGKSVLGADDKSGVWLMLHLLRSNVGACYDYVFCCDEEIGGFGSQTFAKDYASVLKSYSCHISLDRANVNDVAIYGYDNEDLITIFENLGFERALGSFTDCVNMSSESELACVNLSVGYFSEHTPRETQDLNVLYNLLKILKDDKLIIDLSSQVFEADELPYEYNWRGDYEDFQNWDGTSSTSKDTKANPIVCDCCNQHLPVYAKVAHNGRDHLLCEDCYEYY